MILAGWALEPELADQCYRLKLYDQAFTHGYREEADHVLDICRRRHYSERHSAVRSHKGCGGILLRQILREFGGSAGRAADAGSVKVLLPEFSGGMRGYPVLLARRSVRLVAPLLQHKTAIPVGVIDELGERVISKLSGHLDVANRLTLRTTELIDSHPFITTASDV